METVNHYQSGPGYSLQVSGVNGGDSLSIDFAGWQAANLTCNWCAVSGSGSSWNVNVDQDYVKSDLFQLAVYGEDDQGALNLFASSISN